MKSKVKQVLKGKRRHCNTQSIGLAQIYCNPIVLRFFISNLHKYVFTEKKN